MPEGDTLWRMAAALRPALLARRIEHAQPAALRRLEGSTVIEVRSVGKHLLIRFDSGLTLRTHMGMTGRWRVHPAGQDRLATARPASAILETDSAAAILVGAPTVELTRTGRERTGHLGPDLLDLGADLDAAVRRARQLPQEMPLGELLLDQRVAAGIGNIHRCELLWSQRLSPWTPQRELDDAALRDLFVKARQGLLRGTQPGRHRHAVHGRAGQPCPRCGAPIRVRAQAAGSLARPTYWCPSCQPHSSIEPKVIT